MPSLIQTRLSKSIREFQKLNPSSSSSPLWEDARKFSYSLHLSNSTVEKVFIGLKDILILTITLNSKGYPTFISFRYANHYEIQVQSF